MGEKIQVGDIVTLSKLYEHGHGVNKSIGIIIKIHKNEFTVRWIKHPWHKRKIQGGYFPMIDLEKVG